MDDFLLSLSEVRVVPIISGPACYVEMAWSDKAWTSSIPPPTSLANLFLGPNRNSNSFSSSQKLAHAFFYPQIKEELELQSLSFFLLSTRLVQSSARLVLIRYDRSESASRSSLRSVSPCLPSLEEGIAPRLQQCSGPLSTNPIC